MKQSKTPLWKKSMLQSLNWWDITSSLDEICENGCEFGYEQFDREESVYYHEYKDHFDDLAAGASSLYNTLVDSEIRSNWDNMTVALLGYSQQVLGYDAVQADYYAMMSFEENWAVEEATKRIERLTKRQMIHCFREVLTTLLLFFDIKASHDCLTSIVEELDERAAMSQKGEAPQRAWVE